jgi:hypothetical protein
MIEEPEFHYTARDTANTLTSWRKAMMLSMKIPNVLMRLLGPFAHVRPREPVVRPQAAAALSSHIQKDIGIDEGRTSSAER